MTDEGQVTKENPPHTVMERIDALEKQVATLMQVMERNFGARWLQQVSAPDNPDDTPG